MSKYDDILKPFVREDVSDISETNKWVAMPVTVGDAVLATNGHILITFPAGLTEGEYPVCPRVKSPLEVLTQSERFAEPKMFKGTDIFNILTAKDIEGLTSFVNCDECGGSAVCDDCACEMAHPCGYCGGGGKGTDFQKYIKLHGEYFAWKYFRMILDVTEKFNGGVFNLVACDYQKPAVFEIGELTIVLIGVKNCTDERAVKIEDRL